MILNLCCSFTHVFWFPEWKDVHVYINHNRPSKNWTIRHRLWQCYNYTYYLSITNSIYANLGSIAVFYFAVCLFFSTYVFSTIVIDYFLRSFLNFHSASLLRIIYRVISARLCTRALKTWRIRLGSVLVALAHKRAWGPRLFFSHSS